MKAIIDDSCIGCGLCPDICPEVFELGDDNIAKVKVEEIPEEHQEAAREAADGCPVDAIQIEE